MWIDRSILMQQLKLAIYLYMASSSSTSTSSCGCFNSPCAACKFLRRKCLAGCIFAPYFRPEEPHKFANVHKIFGASNVAKLLNELLPHQREDAVNSLAYEAEARVKDPVYGCVGAISVLQRHLQKLQKELDAANAHLLRYANMGLPLPPNNLYSGGDPLTTSHHASSSSSSSSSMVQAAPPNYPPPWPTCTNIFSGTDDQSNDIDIHTSGDHIIKGEESSL